eukprot:761030-Hanusia_phi.AAC.5
MSRSFSGNKQPKRGCSANVRSDESVFCSPVQTHSYCKSAELPEFFGNIPIDEKLVQEEILHSTNCDCLTVLQVEENYLTTDGEFDVVKLKTELKKGLQQVNKAIFEMQLNKQRKKKEPDQVLKENHDDPYVREERRLFKDLDRLLEAQAYLEDTLAQIEQQQEEERFQPKPKLNVTRDAVWIEEFDVNPFRRPLDVT